MSKEHGITISSLPKKAERGFTLFQAAIGLMVLGLIGTGVMHGVTVEMAGAGIRDTQGRLSTIENAINQYYTDQNSRYPCPASFIAGEDDTDFGLEGDCTPANIGNIKLCSDIAWKSAEGFCKTDDTTDAVLIGAVPFDALKLNSEDSLDFWKNKIVYAVTYEQTDDSTFNSNTGTIRITTMDDAAAVAAGTEDGVPDEKTFTDRPDFMLISLGENGVGGYTKDGVALPACGLPDTGYEAENCNFDNLFFADSDSESSNTGAKSLVLGATYYDDITRYQIRVPLSLWFPSPDYPNHIISSADRIGIGTLTPKQSLHVAGNIKAVGSSDAPVKHGTVNAHGFCDNTITNCFDPESISGEKIEMTCSSPSFGQQGLLRLAQNRFWCNSGADYVAELPIDGDVLILDTTIYKPHDCVSLGQLMIGFDAAGNPQCATP